MYPNIFDIQKSNMDMKFIRENGEIELEIATDIIDNMSNVPILGNLINLCKIGFNIRDWYFINKLSKFLEQSKDISNEKKKNSSIA